MSKKQNDFKRKLPKYKGPASWFDGDGKDWRAKIDDAKRKLLGGAKNAEDANVAKLARKVATARKIKKELESEIAEYNVELAALDELLTHLLEGEEQESVKLNDGITVYLKRTVYPTVIDKQKSFAWMKKNLKPAELFAMLSVHPSTYKSYVTERIEKGLAPPPGTEVFIKITAACRGLNGNGDE